MVGEILVTLLSPVRTIPQQGGLFQIALDALPLHNSKGAPPVPVALRIGLDFDGLFTNPAALKSLVAKRIYGKTLPIERCKRERAVPRIFTNNQYSMISSLVSGDPRIAPLVPMVPGAIDHARLLAADGHQVVIITSRDGPNWEIARQILEREGLMIPIFGVGYGKSKRDMARYLELDVFADDDLDKLQPLVGIVPHLFLFGWEYNLRARCGRAIRRVNSWEEFCAQVHKLR